MIEIKALIEIGGKLNPVRLLVDSVQHTIGASVFVMVQFIRKDGTLGGKQMWTPALIASSQKAYVDQASIESDFDARVLAKFSTVEDTGESVSEVEEPTDEGESTSE